MPLIRYQIRNEYGSADPELFKAADKDDPEALLEGVAMAGLVGVLRQLGDLAEFAAEVFHDLHEEVITTSARGHGLMIRVQQLEAEVPSIEKAFLSHTNHTSFFTSAGCDWHPNLQSGQNLVAHGDLPRFVMDSYEECRGPPRLFLLDKFDVAGAGACLKRYTDPSVFRVESTASERSNILFQREKRNRKIKKKGQRNGGAPENGPKSHTKLHQLFLEERIENCFNDSSRLVKLKRRQLKGRIDSKNGKSYMEKIMETPPEHKLIYEASVIVPTLHSMSDNTNDPGLRILDITTVSPASKSPERVSTCSSCLAQEEELMSRINSNVSDKEILKMPESTADIEIETSPSLQMAVVENQLEYGDGKTGSSIDGYHSDEVISEVDSYMDALATMESEIETDNEPRSETVYIRKQISEYDANAEHIETLAQLSDSQSFINSSGSDDGNSSFKRDQSSFSCSDTVSCLVDNYDSEGSAKALPSISKACMVNIENMPWNQDSSHSHESLNVPSEAVSSANHTIPSEDYHIRDRESINVDGTSENALHLSSVLVQAVEPEAMEKVEDTMLRKGYQEDRTINNKALREIESSPSSLLPSVTSRTSTNYSSDIYNAIVLKGDDNIVAAEAKYDDLTRKQDLNDDNIIVAEAKHVDLPLPAAFLRTQDLKDRMEKVSDDVLQVEVGLSETDETSLETDANIVDITRVADDGKVTIFTQADDTSDDLSEMQLSQDETVNPESVILPSSSVSSHDELTSPGDQDHEDFVKYSNLVTGKVQADEVIDSVNCSETVTETVLAREVVNFVNCRADGAEVQTDEVEVVDSVNCSEAVTVKVQADEVIDSVNCSDTVTGNVQADEVVDSVNGSDIVTEKVRAHEMIDTVDYSDVATETATLTETTPKNLNHFSGEENIRIGKPPTGVFQADGFAFDADPKAINNLNGVVSMKSDSLENHPGFGDQYPNQNEYIDSSDYPVGPIIGNEVKHLEVAPAPLDSKDELVSDYSDSVIIDDIHDLPVPKETQCPSVIGALTSGQESTELKYLQSVSNSSHQIDVEEGIEFIAPPHFCFSSSIETSCEPLPCLQAKHEEMEALQVVVDFPNSSRQEQQPRGQLDEEKDELVQSTDPVQHDQSYKSKASEVAIQAGHSLSELYTQHSISECDITGRTMDILQPVLPSYILLPELPQADMNEMPPLPPLPPMQWRLGKVQQPFLAPPRSENPLQPILPSKAEEKSICLESSNSATLQSENSFSCFQDYKFTHISGHSVHNSMQPPSFSLPLMSNENLEYSSATMEKQYNNPFSTLPPMPKENPEHNSRKPGGESLQSDLNLPFGPMNNDVNCKSDRLSSHEQSFQLPSNSVSETGLTPDISEHKPQDFEMEQRNSNYKMAPSSFVKNKQSDLLTSGEELTSSSTSSLMPAASTSDVRMPNGNPPTSSKLLRPRSPLIEAVAAHDKSKLRKVSDRILPEIGPKVDERDSLLAQIRTKSFSLKPALVTRPSIQGPKTNLRVAAILEKANAIRQAFTGSDDDYDNDSWSDSE